MGFNGATPATPVIPLNAKPANLASIAGKVGMYRWAICAMLFLATWLPFCRKAWVGMTSNTDTS